jgi:hypothetical protein
MRLKAAIQSFRESLRGGSGRLGANRTALERLSDDAWFDLQFDPDAARAQYGLSLPSFPPDDVQLRFTGLAARDNLMQARSFYEYAVARSRLRQVRNPRILDFGGGWGRVSRFFLRDTRPDLITIVDCLEDSIHWLRETRNPCDIRKNEPMPPVSGLPQGFHLIYAYSVFSHLSPRATDAWLDYLSACLLPGGSLVITTRGRAFIDYLASVPVDSLRTTFGGALPAVKEIDDRYRNGHFQFYPSGGGGALTSDFYGEAIIPKAYFVARFGSDLIAFSEAVPHVDQAVVVIRHRGRRG